MFDKGKAWCVREPLQLIHSDICGLIETPSLSKQFTFIDDYSLKYWVCFFKYKSETFGIFQEFKSMVEKESRKKNEYFEN